MRAVGKAAANSSATRSTPGPQAMKLACAAHCGHCGGVAPLEISAAQYVVISVLAKSKCVDSATQLCKDLSYDAGAMTRMVDRLEAKGLISRRRCPDDRRSVKLELTEAGLAALPKLRECSVRVLNHFLRGFTQSEARQFESFLVRMLQNT